MTAREVVKRLNKEGWYEDRQNGSHRVFKHPDKPGDRVNVPIHNGDVSKGTLRNIYEDAGWGRP